MVIHKLYLGDVRDVLKDIPDNSVHCVVTSPPYFGLRDYGESSQIGLEQTPGEYVEALVQVFKEIRRTLKDDGTVWLNLGDSYANNTKSGTKMFGNPEFNKNRPSREATKTPNKIVPKGLKLKDLIGIPWRVAFGLQDDGWYLRSDIVWEKPNCMPESVKDRPTRSHEYLFLLSKNPKYYYDSESIKEAAVGVKGGKPQKIHNAVSQGEHGKSSAFNSKWIGSELRSRRTVWTISTTPFKGAHFATFPPKLIEPCILAGCPIGGTVLDPFGGSGTVSMVAEQLGRNSIYVDLNSNYREMAISRLKSVNENAEYITQ